MDPDLKTWRRDLVCDNCKRWASALTWIRPGDSWNGSGDHPELVGKRICYTCIKRAFRLGPPEPDPQELPIMVRESILIVSTAVIFLTVLVARVDPTIHGMLFVGSLGFVALERELRNRFHRRRVMLHWELERRRALEEWKSRGLSADLVSIDTLFGQPTM